jgi:hypothetical protein
MQLLVRALIFYAWYAATVSVVFGIVLSVLFFVSHVQKWTNQRQLKVLHALRRRSGLG